MGNASNHVVTPSWYMKTMAILSLVYLGIKNYCAYFMVEPSMRLTACAYLERPCHDGAIMLLWMR